MATIEKRPFGRSGHMSTFTLFGAAALKNVSQDVADQTLDVLLHYGVNHIDVAPRYGVAEERIGPWMDRHRKDFFLATKTGERTASGAREELHRSLEKLRVDRVDLIQLHALYHPDEWDIAMSEDGALAALIDAKSEGLVKQIGVTGHGWTIAAMHKRSLAHFDFDSVLLPLNWIFHSNERYRREFLEVRDLCRERGIALQTIKSTARGPWAGRQENYNTWYQPLDNQQDIDRAVHWVQAWDGVFLNTVGDVTLLPKVLDAASRFGESAADHSDAAMAGMIDDAGLSSLFGLGT
jgi:aryl-alcohol dehydrogenase-like predicted oxidoreductase